MSQCPYFLKAIFKYIFNTVKMCCKNSCSLTKWLRIRLNFWNVLCVMVYAHIKSPWWHLKSQHFRRLKQMKRRIDMKQKIMKTFCMLVTSEQIQSKEALSNSQKHHVHLLCNAVSTSPAGPKAFSRICVSYQQVDCATHKVSLATRFLICKNHKCKMV